MSGSTLVVDGLFKSYGDRRVLEGLSLSASSGFTWLHGSNGSGKTTLLECLAGIEPFERGSVVIDGLSLRTDRNRYLECVFYVPDDLELHAGIAIGDFDALMAAGKGGIDPATTARHRAAFGLHALSSRLVSTLSFGTQKKLVLSLALASRCPVLLLDEPTDGLDGPGLRYLDEQLRLQRDRIWLIASHDAERLTRLATQVIAFD